MRGGKTYRESGIRIYEREGPPEMVTFKTEYRTPSIWNWFWLFGIDTRSDESWLPDFNIPPGSIKEGYSL